MSRPDPGLTPAPPLVQGGLRVAALGGPGGTGRTMTVYSDPEEKSR